MIKAHLIWLAFFLGFGLCPAMSADLASGLMTIDDFKTRGQREDGSGQWELSGARATLLGETVKIETFTFRLFGAESAGEAVITSPHCLYHRTGRTAASQAPLHLVTSRFTLDGVGYDLSADNQTLHVRHQVRMVFKGDVPRVDEPPNHVLPERMSDD